MLELALHVLDVLQNAVEAGATQVTLTVDEDQLADRLTIEVADNGRGMDPQTAARAADPFYTTRTTRHVGLGLPLYAMAAEQAGGRLDIRSQSGQGTVVTATFRLSHPDRQPLGDLAGTVLAFLLAPRPAELRYTHRVHGAGEAPVQFEFSSAEIRAALGGLSFNQPAVAKWLGEFLAEGENALRARGRLLRP